MPALTQFVQRVSSLLRAKERRDLWAWAILLMASVASGSMDAQSQARQISSLPSPVQVALRWLVLRSPIIFYGEVLTPESAASTDTSFNSIFTVRIRVVHGVRGVHAGDVFSFGRWRSSEGLALAPRQRVILFLHQPNAAGVTSSVAGNFGLLQVSGGNLVDVRSLTVLASEVAPPFGGISRLNAPAAAHYEASIRNCAPQSWSSRSRFDPPPGSGSDCHAVVPPAIALGAGVIVIPVQQLLVTMDALAQAQPPWWDQITPAEAANAP